MFNSLRISERVLTVFFVCLIVMLIFVYALKIVTNPEEFTLKKDSNLKENVDKTNPASYYCVQEGGTIDVVGDERFCVFSNGRMCEEWDYFRGVCPGML